MHYFHLPLQIEALCYFVSVHLANRMKSPEGKVLNKLLFTSHIDVRNQVALKLPISLW